MEKRMCYDENLVYRFVAVSFGCIIQVNSLISENDGSIVKVEYIYYLNGRDTKNIRPDGESFCFTTHPTFLCYNIPGDKDDSDEDQGARHHNFYNNDGISANRLPIICPEGM